jgi:UDP-N-acetyl-D-galactosamine dehydrogenase
VLGLTFKENVPDLRNSRVPDIINELREYGVQVVVHDPLAEPEEAVAEYGIHLASWDRIRQVDGLILAVAHHVYTTMSTRELLRPLRRQRAGVIIDVKGVLKADALPPTLRYWRL